MEIKNINDIKVTADEMHDSEFSAQDFGFNSEKKMFYLKSHSPDDFSKEFYLQFNGVEQYRPINLEKINKGKATGGVFNTIKVKDNGLSLEIISQDLRIQLKLNHIDGMLEINAVK